MLDKDNNGFLSLSEFAIGFIVLFYEPYDQIINFIFDFYDIDKDSYITKEDVKFYLPFLHIPIKPNNDSAEINKFKSKLNDRNQFRDDIQEIIQKTFGESQKLSKEDFKHCVENVCSETFIYVTFGFHRRSFV